MHLVTQFSTFRVKALVILVLMVYISNMIYVGGN